MQDLKKPAIEIPGESSGHLPGYNGRKSFSQNQQRKDNKIHGFKNMDNLLILRLNHKRTIGLFRSFRSQNQDSKEAAILLIAFHPEMVSLANLGVNLHVCLFGDLQVASAQTVDFLDIV